MIILAKSEVLHIRVSPDVKSGVEATLNKLGLSTNEAVNIFLHQVLLTGGLPFDVKLPSPEFNAETIAALEEAEVLNKSGKGYTSMEALMKELKS